MKGSSYDSSKQKRKKIKQQQVIKAAVDVVSPSSTQTQSNNFRLNLAEILI